MPLLTRGESSANEPVDVCVATDLDRTCLRTGVATLVLLKAAEDTVGLEQSHVADEIDARRERHETTQITDIFSSQGLNDRQQADIFQVFVDRSDPRELLYDDVDEYLVTVNESEFVTAVLLTMGPRLQQEAKICAAGLEGRLASVILDPAHVQNAEIKAPHIWDWQRQETGLFVPKTNFGLVAPLPSRHVVLVDDKYIAFGTGKKRPEAGNVCDIGGFWINRAGDVPQVTAQEQHAVAEGIVYAPGLRTVTGYVRDPQRFALHPMTAVQRARAA